ncbi:CDK-activating kinase assembly factor MAT1 [Gaeumannomyces tritici R3-111a-1]|uniref:RNA polymerase II transcription factor B subunit 3 n=1 Tax=Gaeumannomyces tritici (strain R3-111a-1) TaxID=644352 RepID=J3NI72_GAET3|nr:CDK-activating kinase assembly factor MAT1 [Gaeumannomyces tritici R3-111a-1]EJT80965.1 CDK-activating kinase assembly factor MAT1 [Gaeumannomyces tritici R3-111a-1]
MASQLDLDHDTMGEKCPSCNALRYLNPDMVLKTNEKCYHQICDTCVRHNYENGQARCLIKGCEKILRMADWRTAFFADLDVEREVDVRRRVARIFNQTGDDFESLQAYNDYLDMVETLVFDLVGTDRARATVADENLKRYEAEHKAQIERSRRKGAAAEERARQLRAAEQEAAAARRREARDIDRDEQRRKLLAHEDALDTLARAPEGTAARIVERQRDQHRLEALADGEARDLRAAAGAGGLSIRGLKEKKKAAVEGPYDPFGGLDLGLSRHQLQDTYRNDWLETYKHKPSHATGGYSMQEYYARAMFEAFAGIAVFVEDEKETGLVTSGPTAAAVATLGASLAAVKGTAGRT